MNEEQKSAAMKKANLNSKCSALCAGSVRPYRWWKARSLCQENMKWGKRLVLWSDRLKSAEMKERELKKYAARKEQEAQTEEQLQPGVLRAQ